MKASWRTTLLGWLSILGTLISQVAVPMLDADPNTVPDLTLVWPLLATGFGLLFARDDKVSSEQAGAGITPRKGQGDFWRGNGMILLIVLPGVLCFAGCVKPVGTVGAHYNSTTGETIVDAGIEFRKRQAQAYRDAQIAACKAATQEQLKLNMLAFTTEQNRLCKQCKDCAIAEFVNIAGEPFPVSPPVTLPSPGADLLPESGTGGGK